MEFSKVDVLLVWVNLYIQNRNIEKLSKIKCILEFKLKYFYKSINKMILAFHSMIWCIYCNNLPRMKIFENIKLIP